MVIRPLASGDEPEVRRFHELLGERDARLRFFAEPPKRLGRLAAALCHRDERQRGLGAFSGTDLVGVAHYMLAAATHSAGPVAECAVLVPHRAQRHGVGTALIQHLTEAARAHRIARLNASVPAENTVMLEVLHMLGWTRTGPLGATVQADIELSTGAVDR
ncbi:GNAT family N-acetyltransferase [Rhodococcus aetherivorans]|uniref:GNAT family N-acetyltransferase n=1 Tax=Rhodococcus aetherivorans TaxID=191292 RepID=UPI00388F14DA